jgi:hypothetical protein
VGAAEEYHEEAAVVSIHGGATSLPSLGVIKRFSREILAAEPEVDQGSSSGGHTFPSPLTRKIILIAAQV